MTLDQALARLAAVPPRLFTRERSALVEQLRKEGNAKAARIVKARRAPTIPVWIVNRLALEHRKTLHDLIAAADRLKATQLGRRKEPGGLTRAMASYRALLDRLLDHGRTMLEEVGTGAHESMLVRVERTLSAALVDAAGRETLRRGGLQQELDAPGFDVFGGARPARAGSSRRSTKWGRRAAVRQKGEERGREDQLLEQQRLERIRPLQRAVDDARAKLTAAAERTHRARARLETLLRDVRQAREELRESILASRRVGVDATRAQRALAAAGKRPPHRGSERRA
jgi:hypothetical protein